MIKSELIETIAKTNNLSPIDAQRVVNCVFMELSKAMMKEQRIELRGFGVLSVRTHKAKTGRNPKTGEAVQIPEKKVPFFKAGKAMLDALNEKASGQKD